MIVVGLADGHCCACWFWWFPLSSSLVPFSSSSAISMRSDVTLNSKRAGVDSSCCVWGWQLSGAFRPCVSFVFMNLSSRMTVIIFSIAGVWCIDCSLGVDGR